MAKPGDSKIPSGIDIKDKNEIKKEIGSMKVNDQSINGFTISAESETVPNRQATIGIIPRFAEKVTAK